MNDQGVQIGVYKSLEDARDTWKEFQNSGELYVFQTYEWLENWYVHIGQYEQIDPCIVSVRDGSGRLLYLFPFEIKHRGAVKILTWLGDKLIDYGAPIIAPVSAGIGDAGGVDFDSVWRGILERLPSIDVVWLTKVPRDINDSPNPLCSLPCLPYHSSAHLVRLSGGDWESFYERHAGAKTRSTDRRKARRLSTLGRVSCAMTDGSDVSSLRNVTHAMVRQKAMRYDEIRAPNLFVDEGHRKFFTEPMEALRASGRLHVAGLYLDDTMITTHWGMIYKKRFYYYMPSFATGPWVRCSPGRLLLFDLFKWCFDNDVTVFDFTLGDESYKRDWCDEELPLYQYLSARSGKGRIYQIICRIYITLLNNPFGIRAARTIRRFFH
jgi:CelD/BcsL family acetyltransferase involved in cellulose biosynthesis